MNRKTALIMIGIVSVLTCACSVQIRQSGDENTSKTAEAEAEETVASDQEDGFTGDTVISTELFTVTVPDEFKGKFLAKADGNEISIYDKASCEAGFGGFVFSVTVDKDDEVLAGGMYTKVGEYETSDGQIYDICKSLASEVQWDYNGSEEMPEDYEKLLNAADSIIESAKANGDGSFMYGVGLRGEELYGMTIAAYTGAFEEGWDADRFEEEGMSPEFSALIKSEGEKAFDKMGFAYKDISNDGVDELLVGIIGDKDEPGVVYDIYTMKDRKPALVVSGTSRNSYRGMEYGGIANVFSGGAAENGVRVYIIEPGTGELGYQYGVKYDEYTDEDDPWFVNDSDSDDDDTWKQTTQEEYDMWLDRATEQFLKLDFIPFSQIMPTDYSKADLSRYETFDQMTEDFKKGMGYAEAKLGDTDVFLVSTGTYTGEDGARYAMDASVFIYDKNGKIVYLGKVQSGGTAYPLMITDGYLFTGGHHNVTKWTVKNGRLEAAEEACETFDTDGKATYYLGSEEAEDDSDLLRLFEEYFSGEEVDFKEV